MLQDRSLLEENLINIIQINNANKKMNNLIKEFLMEKGISTGTVQDIWSMRKPLSIFGNVILYLLTKKFYELTGQSNIKPSDFFTETEMRDGDNYQFVIDNTIDKLTYPYIFKYSNKIRDDQYNTKLTIQQVKQLLDSALLSYNFDTQRNPKLAVEDGELIKTANINPKSVNEITEALGINNFISNMITINLLQDGTDEFVYNEKKGEITVISGQMNIIDGFHRLMSMVVAVANNPNSDYITEVRFTNWDIQKCRNFINQEDKRNKIDKRYMNSVININKWGNKVVTKINESGSDLKGKIVTNPIVLKHNKALTMFDIMSDAIELGYEIKSNMDVYKISQWLVDFFDFIIGFYPDNFIGEDNIAKSKEISAINLPAMFVGYICISKHLYNQTNWEDKLNNILKDINFDINNPVWKDIGIIKDDKPSITLKRPQLKKIFNYFTTIVSKEVVYEN